jgi:magnesium transporter
LFHCGGGFARNLRPDEALSAIDRPDARVWINLLAPAQSDLVPIAQKLQLHELAIEDVFSAQSHAKIEPYPSNLFCVIPALNLTTSDDLFDVVNLNAFLGPNYLITAERAALPAVGSTKAWLARSSESLRRGPDFLLYLLLDGIVDEYLDLTDQMNDQVDGLEERIFGTPDKSVSEAIFDLRHKAAWLRRLVSPQREILNILTNRPHEFISRDTQLYLRDVYDHVQRVRENAEIFHDLLQGAMETYLTLVANRTNEVMKLLAAVGTVVLPINVITGLYGTNFDVLPGSKNPYGFWVLCSAVILAATTMTLVFRSRKWF